jgi:hypothetical protein
MIARIPEEFEEDKDEHQEALDSDNIDFYRDADDSDDNDENKIDICEDSNDLAQ